ncbi:MAG: hypothetical protein QMD71_08675 [bacterium]|nr:hypothetical protein [bacterium]
MGWKKINCRKLLLLAFGAIIPRLLLFSIVAPHPERIFITNTDAFQYDRIATNILEHSSFSLSSTLPYEPTSFRTPIYPLFLATIYRLCGERVLVAIIFFKF